MAPTVVADPEQVTEAEWLAQARAYFREARAAHEQITLSSRPDMLTPAQAADLLSVSRSTVSRLLSAGKLKSVKVGAHHRIARHDVLAYHDRRIRAMVAATSDELEADLDGRD
jgi:excisionase family DNA binding protein